MLVPAAPLLLLDQRYFCWVQVLGAFTMFPLLIKDKLRVPYVALCALYIAAVSVTERAPASVSVGALWKSALSLDSTRSWLQFGMLVRDLVASKEVKSLFLTLSCTGEAVSNNKLTHVICLMKSIKITSLILLQE